MKKYVFKPYNPIFPILFEKEKLRLQKYLTGSYQIEHIGSTAIPKLGGKGIIDIYIAVPKGQMKQTSQEIQQAGYEFRMQASKMHHHLFHRIYLPDDLEGIRTYHVHITYPEQQDWINTLAFRDYLRTHPQDVKEYAEIKKKAATEANEDKDAYMTIKSPMMQEILQKALASYVSKSLVNQLTNLISPELCINNKMYEDFLALIKEGKLTREENPENHCCVFFIPYNPQTKQIFIVHHKKAKQWVVPGGHIEKGEILEDAVKREANEELGIKIEKVVKPFLFSIMYIHNEGQLCKAHHDIWYLIPTKDKLNIDFTEFNDVKWATISEARKIITHKTYLQAIERIEK